MLIVSVENELAFCIETDSQPCTMPCTPIQTRRQDLSRHSKASPFYLDTKPSTTGKDGPDAAIETFTERESKKPRTRRPPLSSVMRLDPVYFPEELYSSQDKRASKASQSRPQQEIYWKTQSSLDDADGLQNRLDRLAEMESKAGAQGGTGEGPSSAGRRDADQDVQEEALIEDEDEEEEDDYYAGNDFDDDDDGGDDGDDDGGGDALY